MANAGVPEFADLPRQTRGSGRLPLLTRSSGLESVVRRLRKTARRRRGAAAGAAVHGFQSRRSPQFALAYVKRCLRSGSRARAGIPPPPATRIPNPARVADRSSGMKPGPKSRRAASAPRRPCFGPLRAKRTRSSITDGRPFPSDLAHVKTRERPERQEGKTAISTARDEADTHASRIPVFFSKFGLAVVLL